MKTMLKASALFLTLFFLIGCASGPKYAEIAKTIPELAPDKGRIYIYRNSILGAAIQPKVKLNGEVIGSAVPKGFYFVDRSPGNYKMMTSTEVDRTLSFVLEKEQTRFVRLNISIGFFVGHVYPELVDDEVGKKEINECSYVDKK
jgi:hypothetical protein